MVSDYYFLYVILLDNSNYPFINIFNMSSYRRAKREDYVQPEKRTLSFQIGSANSSVESLECMCKDKSQDIMKSIKLNNGEEIDVVFWTAGDAELICVSKITKNEAGVLSYRLDFSESTL